MRKSPRGPEILIAVAGFYNSRELRDEKFFARSRDSHHRSMILQF